MMKIFAIIFILTLAVYSKAQTPVLTSSPRDIVVDSKDNVYVLVKYGMIKITPDGTLIELRKIDGNKALDYTMYNLVIDSKDNLYVGKDNLIRKIRISDDNKATIEHYAGDPYKYRIVDGNRNTAIFTNIDRMTIDKDDNLYVTDSYDKISEQIGTNYVTDPYYRKDSKLKYIKNFSLIRKISADGEVSTLKNTEGKYVLPNGLAGMTCDPEGNLLYTTGGIARSVEKINVKTGAFTHIAGKPYKREWCPVYITGDTSKAELFDPGYIIINNKGEIYYSDNRSHRITKITAGKVIHVAGNNIIDPCGQNIGGRAQEGHKDGKALTALFSFPRGIAFDSKGNMYIADDWNNCIRKMSAAGIVSTINTPVFNYK
jgi:NHL repeat